MRALFSGEHRRAAIMGVVGMPVILALLVFRLFAGGEDATPTPPAPAAPAPPAATVPPAGVAAPAAPVPAPLPPVDPALLRDPFCPLVAAPGSGPVECRPPPPPAPPAPVEDPPPTVTPELQAIGLQAIYVDGHRHARMHVGPLIFPNLHEGEVAAGSLRVVSLSERCGEFEFAGEPFSLCVGEEARK